MKEKVPNTFKRNLTVTGKKRNYEIPDSERNFDEKIYARHKDYNNEKRILTKKSSKEAVSSPPSPNGSGTGIWKKLALILKICWVFVILTVSFVA